MSDDNNKRSYISTPHILVIAEKPSVGIEIAKILEAKEKHNGYLKGNSYIVTWCVGHLIQPAEPSDYSPSFKNWNLSDLPILPTEWRYNVSEKTKTQYEIIEKLLNDKNVYEIVCATDAGREGELIFRLVYNHAKCKKPVKRLWISSLEENSIRKGFENLKTSKEYDNLYESASSRQKADWLVGMNLSRLYSIKYKTSLNIGRVQTPTLNLLVTRDEQIKNFQKEAYYIVSAKTDKFVARKRVESQDEAISIESRCNKKSGHIASLEKTVEKEAAPRLYDLTGLQKDCNELLGFSAQETLTIAQSLYEKKMITYPRTDSKYISEDMKRSTQVLIQKLIASPSVDYDTGKKYDLSKADVQRIINDTKITDHHAIITTQKSIESPADLSVEEESVLTMISYCLLIAVYSSYVYEKTKVIFISGIDEFTATGTLIVDEGFKKLEKNLRTKLRKSVKAEEDNTLPDMNMNETLSIHEIAIEKKYTQPPKEYTEKTLLSAMENALKNLDDTEIENNEGLPSGIGTPATRAAIIERLIKTDMIFRLNKSLFPTEKGRILISCLPEKIKSPSLTAEWEEKLEKIVRGELSSSEFDSAIKEYITNITVEAKETVNQESPFQEKEDLESKESIGICPRCGNDVIEYKKTFRCSSDCGFAMWKEDKFFTDKKKRITYLIAKELLKNKRAMIKGLYSPKKDKTYDAYVVLEDTGKYVNYKLEFTK